MPKKIKPTNQRKRKKKKKYNLKDMVNHPAHYNGGQIEVIEYLEDQFMDRPHEWNAVKYISRANKKGTEVQDLEKAIWYLKRKIAILKGNPPRPNEM